MSHQLLQQPATLHGLARVLGHVPLVGPVPHAVCKADTCSLRPRVGVSGSTCLLGGATVSLPLPHQRKSPIFTLGHSWTIPSNFTYVFRSLLLDFPALRVQNIIEGHFSSASCSKPGKQRLLLSVHSMTSLTTGIVFCPTDC